MAALPATAPAAAAFPSLSTVWAARRVALAVGGSRGVTASSGGTAATEGNSAASPVEVEGKADVGESVSWGE